VSQAQFTSTRTLGAELERDRLEHRASRIAVAITVLRDRAREHRRELGGAPVHIRQAIADFEAQLASMNARLGDLAHGDEPTPSRAMERVR
jgi:hypothetical protein